MSKNWAVRILMACTIGLAMVGVFSYFQYAIAHNNDSTPYEKIAMLHGDQNYTAKITYPAGSGSGTISVTLELDGKPIANGVRDKADPNLYDVSWKSTAYSNGQHLITMKAYFADQAGTKHMIGEESREVLIEN